MTPPIVTLTSDFGLAGHYVAAMKGRILALCPDARLVDLSHGIAAFAVLEASFLLAEASKSFPPGTVHLAVVDPGVGSSRKAMIVRAGDHWFVGPDNGLFTPFLTPTAEIWEIRPQDGPPPSTTFHGRDIFAPAAARLAAGTPVADLGRPMAQPVRMHQPRPRRDGSGVVGQVLHADSFGNLITNIRAEDLAGLSEPYQVTAGPARVSRFVRSYHEGSIGESVALIGSSGHLEVAVARGNGALQLGIGPGERVRVEGAHGA